MIVHVSSLILLDTCIMLDQGKSKSVLVVLVDVLVDVLITLLYASIIIVFVIVVFFVA